MYSPRSFSYSPAFKTYKVTFSTLKGFDTFFVDQVLEHDMNSYSLWMKMYVI